MYTRETELRRLRSNDVNRLAEQLGFDGGRRLMEIIPKYNNSQASTLSGDGSNWNGQLPPAEAAVELKYKPEHIRLIEDAARQNSGSYFAEILIDEWGTSGKKHERPTVGLLLQLLMQAELWRAVDFVAEEFLHEPPPERPLDGPAAPFDISLPTEIFNTVAEIANESANYPDTEALNDNANCQLDSITANNRDYYTKYHRVDKELNTTTPKPPPRTQRSRTKGPQQTTQEPTQQTGNSASTAVARQTSATNNATQSHDQQQQPQPIIGQLVSENMSDSNNMTSQNIPMLSSLMGHSNNSHSTQPHTESTYVNDDEANNASEAMPMLSILGGVSGGSVAAVEPQGAISNLVRAAINLPLLTALNLNSGEEIAQAAAAAPAHPIEDEVSSTHAYSEDSSLSNDSIEVDEEGDNARAAIIANSIDRSENEDAEVPAVDLDSEDKYVPNLSIFDRSSPNNDSSLTTVTGTSGENSFELSMNDSSSNSNDTTGLKK